MHPTGLISYLCRSQRLPPRRLPPLLASSITACSHSQHSHSQHTNTYIHTWPVSVRICANERVTEGDCCSGPALTKGRCLSRDLAGMVIADGLDQLAEPAGRRQEIENRDRRHGEKTCGCHGGCNPSGDAFLSRNVMTPKAMQRRRHYSRHGANQLPPLSTYS